MYNAHKCLYFKRGWWGGGHWRHGPRNRVLLNGLGQHAVITSSDPRAERGVAVVSCW